MVDSDAFRGAAFTTQALGAVCTREWHPGGPRPWLDSDGRSRRQGAGSASSPANDAQPAPQWIVHQLSTGRSSPLCTSKMKPPT